MPVTREEIEAIIATVPGFQAAWQGFLKCWNKEDSIPWYLAMGELSHYVVERYAQGATEEFPKLFAMIESLLENPSPELENLIIVGLLEDIQNVASHRDFGMSPFQKWLGPRTLVAWDDIRAYIDRVDAWSAQQKPRWWQFWRRRKVFDPEKALAQVESPELKKIIESMYRKRP
jgi:hypothetical protein